MMEIIREKKRNTKMQKRAIGIAMIIFPTLFFIPTNILATGLITIFAISWFYVAVQFLISKG